jgi:hypothetical protein
VPREFCSEIIEWIIVAFAGLWHRAANVRRTRGGWEPEKEWNKYSARDTAIDSGCSILADNPLVISA